MRLRALWIAVTTCGLALVSMCGVAQAGVIRDAGEQIGKGSTAVAQTTANAAQTAGSSVAEAGKATGGAMSTAATSVGKAAVAAPKLAAQGSKAAAKKIWKTIW